MESPEVTQSAPESPPEPPVVTMSHLESPGVAWNPLELPGVTSGVIMERPCEELSRIFGVGEPHQEGISVGLSNISSSTEDLAVRARRLLSLYRSGKIEGLRTWCDE